MYNESAQKLITGKPCSDKRAKVGFPSQITRNGHENRTTRPQVMFLDIISQLFFELKPKNTFVTLSKLFGAYLAVVMIPLIF